MSLISMSFSSSFPNKSFSLGKKWIIVFVLQIAQETMSGKFLLNHQENIGLKIYTNLPKRISKNFPRNWFSDYYPVNTELQSHYAHATHSDLKKLLDRGKKQRQNLVIPWVSTMDRLIYDISTTTAFPRLYQVTTATITNCVPLPLRCHNDVHDPTTLV